jgi:hypothetical protein
MALLIIAEAQIKSSTFYLPYCHKLKYSLSVQESSHICAFLVEA